MATPSSYTLSSSQTRTGIQRCRKTDKHKHVCEKSMTLLIGLYYLYHKSPKQKKALQRAFVMMDFKASIMPTRIGGTRWLPHLDRSLSAFFKGYRALVYKLQTSSHDNAKAEGFAKLATDGFLILYLLQLKVIQNDKLFFSSLILIYMYL
ncbi:hypothetical protein DPMN_009501 [Dreissena polymorpha]|uniref:Uncharacterized protein n=1 Tax=Dreissena polymorpha TaxID=45954 RepID=A0A9D4N2A4_DREPO|nr:hypothetical protein DPMN_009501 [Dreissena polymorpha]